MKDNKESSRVSTIRMYNVSEYYQILDKVGRGTYGTVYKAKGLKDGRYYAIKKLENNDTKLQQEGFPITALREITLLKQIDHPNIITLKEIIVSRPNKRNLFRGSTFLVFEYMDHDFAGLFKMKSKFSVPQIKCIIKQLLEGVAYLHRNKILHRDIKSANILLNDQGDVKLADFGLGRKIRMQTLFTYKVVTLWYRAPQLLLGSKTYNDKIDVWSVGCVVAEFFTGEVLFRKQTEYAQMERIYQIVGDFQSNDIKISDQSYKIYQNLQDLRPKKAYKREISSYLKKNCPSISQITIDFIERLLHLDPNRRMSCEQALRHPFFNQKPLPCIKTQIQKMQYECHQMFKDRSIKIQRIPVRDGSHQNKTYRHKDNRDLRQFRDIKDKDFKQKGQKDIQDRKYYRNHHDRQHKNKDGRIRDDRYYHQVRKNQRFSSGQRSSYQKDSVSHSSSSRSSQYSSSSRSRSRYDERRHRDNERRSREQRTSRQNYPRRERQDKRRIEVREQRRHPQKLDRQKKFKDQRDDKIYKNDKEERFYKLREDRRKDQRSQPKRQYRVERPIPLPKRDEKKEIKREDHRDQRQKKDDKRQQKRDERKEEKRDERKEQRREERKQERRDERKERKDERRDYRDHRDDWKRDSKQRRYQKYQKAGSYDSRGVKYYEQRDYKRKQQKWDQKKLKIDQEKYIQTQKHGDYSRRDDNSQKRTDKYYFVSGKNAYRKKDHRNSNSSDRSSPHHHFKKDKEYSRQKIYNHERNQRKNYYKKQHSDSNEHRNN